MKKPSSSGGKRRTDTGKRAQRLSQIIFGALALIIILSMLASLVRY